MGTEARTTDVTPVAGRGVRAPTPEDLSRAAVLPPRFQLVGRVGGGGFGDVYLVRDQLLEREVCVKLLRQDAPGAGDPRRRERLLREAQAAAQLKHPSIVTLYDVLDCGGPLALVMEHVEGGSLADRLARHGPLDPDEAVRIALRVASALEYAHERGIVHRDVKPANVMLGADGSVKLGDFGIARLPGKPGITGEVVVGTPSYMSPEQLRGLGADRRSDVYALGCVLHEMITGSPPFEASDLAVLVTRILNEPPPRLAATGRTLPAAVAGAVARALDKDPARRFDRAADLAAALEGRSSRRWLPSGPAARRGAVVLAAVLATAAAALSVALRLRGSPRAALAVVPFEDATGRPELHFVAQGFTAELTRLLGTEKPIGIVPAADVQALERLGAGAGDACRRAGATHRLDGFLKAGGDGLTVAYALTDCRSGRARQESVPVALTNLQGGVATITAQALSWLGIAPAARVTPLAPEAYELYLRALSKAEDMQTGRKEAFAEGRGLLERALAVEPSAEVYSGLARLYFEAVNQGVDVRRENLSVGRHFLDRGLALRPDFPPLLDSRILYDHQEGRVEEAMAAAADRVLAGHLDVVTIGRIARVLRQSGDEATALAFYDHALRLLPRHYPLRTNRARCLFQAGRRSEAVAELRKALADEPGRFWVRWGLADFALLMGDPEAAARQSEGLPPTLPLRLLRLRIDLVRGVRPSFVPDEAVLREAGVDCDLSLWLAEAFALAGDVDTAARCFRSALDGGLVAWAYFDRDPLLTRLRETAEYRRLRAEGLPAQRSRVERLRALARPVAAKLGLAP